MSILILNDYMKNRKKLSFHDNPNAEKILKIGKEINRAKAGGYNAYMVEKEFGRDANKIYERKIDNSHDKEFIKKTFQEAWREN